MEFEEISREEAERRAIAAMGDPEEIGEALNREHSPLLGWLWLISKWLMVGLTVLLLGVLLLSDTVKDTIWWVKTQRDPYLFSYSIHGEDESLSLDKGEPWTLKARVAPHTGEYGDYTVSVLEGRLYELYDTEVRPGAEPYYYYALEVLLRVESNVPWRDFPAGLHFLYAVDDQGNLFPGREDYINLSDLPEGVNWGDTLAWTSSYVERTLPDWTKGLALVVSPPEGRWEPDWVELKLPEVLGDFAFRLELLPAEVKE